MDPWIIRMCREATRRQVIAWVVVLAAGVFVLIANARYWNNFIRGPYTLQAADLARIGDVNATPRYFVSVYADKVVDTGVQEITTKIENGENEGSYVSAGFYAARVGNRYLIVKSATQPPSQMQGELAPIPGDLASKLFSGLNASLSQTECYPFYLYTTGFRVPGYISIAIGAVFLLLLFFFGRRAWLRLRDIETHPVVRRFHRWADPIAISAEAEREAESGVRYRSRGVIVTDHYVIQKGIFSFNIYRFQDLLWAYKKVTKRSANLIPTGKDYAAILAFYGGNQKFQARQKKVDEVLAFASTKAPWAVLGYSKEIAGMFRQQNSAFCQAVEARRQGLISRGAPETV